MSYYLRGYTREPIDNVYYDPKLAYSMHLELSEDGKNYSSLNHNSGVLFALATENADGSLNPMSLKNPCIFAGKNGQYGVLAVRILGDGGEDESSKGSVLFWTTEDFVTYKEEGLISLGENFIEKIDCRLDEDGLYTMCWQESDGKNYCTKWATEPSPGPCPGPKWATEPSPGPCPGSCRTAIEIPDKIAERLMKKLLTPVNTKVEFPAEIRAKTAEELASYRATLSYSDGTGREEKVDWDLTGVDFTVPGSYQIQGRIHQEHFEFPIAFNRADPCIAYWQGKYYFISTNDADHEHTIYVREADTIVELINAEDHLILDAYTYDDIGNLLWAPEFHEINGKLYIFHAATPGEFFHEESHIMELREGGNPILKEDWSRPERIRRKDGSDLCEAGRVITLDMTCFEWEGEWYVSWSQREFLPKDLGAWLYIAKLNPENPRMLASEPVVLSKPDYGWGNNHTFVEEGPFRLPVDDKLYLTFSAAAVDTSYVVSYLVAEHGKDILNPQSWRKNNYPILTSRSVEGEYGTGHNAYVKDGEGRIFNTYHARPGTEGARSSGVRRVHLDIDGAPMLDVTEELDVKKELRTVTTTVIVQ